MRRQKSTYTMRSPEDSVLRQNFDPQNWMPTLSEVPSDWDYSDSVLNNKAHLNAFISLENQITNPNAKIYNNNHALWHPFCFPQEHTKPELIATASDIFDGFSEVSLCVDFSDIELANDIGHQEPFPQLDSWHGPVEGTPPENQNTAISSFNNEQPFELPATYVPPSYSTEVRNPVLQYNLHSRLFLTNYRSISIMLRHLVSVDVSPEGAIYVHSIPGQNIVAVSDNGEKICIIHPNSRVLQEGQNTHIMTHQARLVKICYRGVVFSTTPGSIVYLVDESGTKSTSGKFMDLSKDYSSEVFYGPFAKDFSMRCTDSVNMLSSSTHQLRRNGDDVWCVGDTLIKQDQFGNIEVSRDMGRILVTVLPTAGEVSVRTPAVSVTVGCYSKRYLSVQKGNCRVTSGFCGLTVQNGTQKAGLDRNGKVVIF